MSANSTMDEKVHNVTGQPDVETPSEENSVKEVPIDTTNDYPEGGLRAWLVVAGASGVMFSTMGYGNAFGVYQEYYSTHQLSHESPSAISWIGSLQIFFLFMSNAFGGPLFDRFGEFIIWPASIAYVFSIFMTSLCKTYYQFLLAQGVLGGISMGMLMAPAMAATGQWFNKKRGAAMGLTIAGSSIGGVIFPIALSKMLNNPSLSFGWTVRILGFIMLALIAPANLAIRARLPPRKGTFFLPAAFKSGQYVGLLAVSFLMLMGMFMPFFYLPTFAVGKGMSNQLASYLLSILNGASFFGRVIPGVLGDKLGRLNALFFAGISTGVLIFCMQALDSHASIIVFAGLYGFCSGAIISGFAVCLTQTTSDPKNIGTYMGMGMSFISISALIGPPIDGAFVSRFHGFDQVADFCGALCIAGGLGVMVIKFFHPKGIVSKA